MSKSLSQQLADLSQRAREVEDAIAAARQETREQALARREAFRAAAMAAADRVDRDLRAAGASLEGRWHSLQDKITHDIARLRADYFEREIRRDAQRAADRAARKEEEALAAIDYALASIEDAKLAVLDAVIADLEANETRSS